MQKYLRNAVIVLIVVVALLGIMGLGITNATESLKRTQPIFLSIACLFFIFSIITWVISWSYLVKKRNGVAFKSSILVGFSAA